MAVIAIIDYGMGNIHSVNKALQHCGGKTIVTNKAEEVASAAAAVLPGVGAFADAMQELKNLGLVSVIKEFISGKKPFLGICLGMQLLFESSAESKNLKGLGALKGSVKKIPEGKGLKIPHIGWNQLRQVTAACPLLKNIPDHSYVYFCHSYYPQPTDNALIAATTDYGRQFSAAIWQDFLFGVQFHPEKSQGIGLKMLKNFIQLC